MKHLTYSDKSLLVGDEAADTLVEYGIVLAKNGSADAVTLRGFGSDGDEVEATYLLDPGTILMAETSRTSMPEPDNTRAVAEMREKIARLVSPPSVKPADEPTPEVVDDLDLG